MYAQTALFLGLQYKSDGIVLTNFAFENDQLWKWKGEIEPNQEVIKRGDGFNFTNLVETAQFQMVSFALIC